MRAAPRRGAGGELPLHSSEPSPGPTANRQTQQQPPRPAPQAPDTTATYQEEGYRMPLLIAAIGIAVILGVLTIAFRDGGPK